MVSINYLVYLSTSYCIYQLFIYSDIYYQSTTQSNYLELTVVTRQSYADTNFKNAVEVISI